MKKITALFLAAVFAATLCSCIKKEPESTRTCHGMEQSFSSSSRYVTTTSAPVDAIVGSNAHVIKNDAWSASTKPVSYSKIIFSKEEIRDEMKSVCVQTEKAKAAWAGFDEDFFEENALLYLTFNSADAPLSCNVSSVKKGQSVCVTIECEKSDAPSDMASYTVLVKLPKSSINGRETAEVFVK